MLMNLILVKSFDLTIFFLFQNLISIVTVLVFCLIILVIRTRVAKNAD